MELECSMPNLAQIPLTPELRGKVVLRYRDFLEKLFKVPLWSTYYNTQLILWLNTTYPKFAHVEKPDLSASAVVRYLLQTYATSSSNQFLFQETRRDAFIFALQNHKPTNYLFTYIAAELESLPYKEECQWRLFEDVAALVAKCLHHPECRRHVEAAIAVDCIPEQLKAQFDKEFLSVLETHFDRAHVSFDSLGGKISKLEKKFFDNADSATAAYLVAAATPLAFLNPHNVLGKVSRVFKSKVKGEVFPVENLSLATVPHLWPELVIDLPRLSSADLIHLRGQACGAIQDEIDHLLERQPEEKEATPQEWESTLKGLERLCQSRDLKHMVLYFTGEEFVCFREDEVFKDIANHNTQKYPADFLAKMEKRGAALPSPILNSIDIRTQLSIKQDREQREAFRPVDFDFQPRAFDELVEKFDKV